MEILIAILCYFNLMTYQQAQMSPMQVDAIIMQNQATVQYYYQNQDALQADHSRAQIDRAED